MVPSLAPGTSFNTTWVLQNTGTGNWEASEVDIRYIAAQNNILLHQGSDRYDLTTYGHTWHRPTTSPCR